MPASPIIVTDSTVGGMQSTLVFTEQTPGSHTFTVAFRYAFQVEITDSIYYGIRIDTIDTLVVSERAPNSQSSELIDDEKIVSKRTLAQAMGQFRTSDEGSLVVPEMWFEDESKRQWRILIRVKGCRLESGQLVDPRILFVHTIDIPVSGLPPTTLNG